MRRDMQCVLFTTRVIAGLWLWYISRIIITFVVLLLINFNGGIWVCMAIVLNLGLSFICWCNEVLWSSQTVQKIPPGGRFHHWSEVSTSSWKVSLLQCEVSLLFRGLSPQIRSETPTVGSLTSPLIRCLTSNWRCATSNMRSLISNCLLLQIIALPPPIGHLSAPVGCHTPIMALLPPIGDLSPPMIVLSLPVGDLSPPVKDETPMIGGLTSKWSSIVVIPLVFRIFIYYRFMWYCTNICSDLYFSLLTSNHNSHLQLAVSHLQSELLSTPTRGVTTN